MIIEIILLSIISLSLLFFIKGKFNITDFNIDIKGYKILIIMAVVEITAVFLFKKFSSNEILKILSMSWIIYPAILVVTLFNFKKHCMKLFFLGTMLNFVAIVFNDFKMPVYIAETAANSQATVAMLNSGKDLIHSMMTASTRFKFLCDIITIPPPYPFVKTISIGDILLLAGVFIFWQEAYKAKSD